METQKTDDGYRDRVLNYFRKKQSIENEYFGDYVCKLCGEKLSIIVDCNLTEDILFNHLVLWHRGDTNNLVNIKTLSKKSNKSALFIF